jgi:hypothetical protein
MGLKHELAHSPGCADLPHPDCMHLVLVLRKKKKQMDMNHTQEGISHSHGYTPLECRTVAFNVPIQQDGNALQQAGA